MPSLEVIATGYNVKKLDPAAYGIKDNEQCVRWDEVGVGCGCGCVFVAALCPLERGIGWRCRESVAVVSRDVACHPSLSPDLGVGSG